MNRFCSPCPAQGDAKLKEYQIQLRIGAPVRGEELRLTRPDGTVVLRFRLRPHGVLEKTYGAEKTGEAPDSSAFGACNRTACVSTCVIPCAPGNYTLTVRPDAAAGRYSAFVLTEGCRRPLPLARGFMPETPLQEEDPLFLAAEESTALQVLSFSHAAFPGPADRPAGRRILTVGPNGFYQDLQKAVLDACPGDLFLVDAGYVHEGCLVMPFGGTKTDPVAVVGLEKDGRRPLLDGAGAAYAAELAADNLILDGFEIVRGSKAGVSHHGDAAVLRRCKVHDCGMGVLSDQDVGMGDCELDRCEIFDCGAGMYSHQIYLANDILRFPQAVMRIHGCHIHDARGGNNIKSRAVRNLIWNNRITNAFYHNLELIGPDPEFNPCRFTPECSSDVFGNWFENRRWYQFRLGGDGTGDSMGRFRFFNNTVISDFRRSGEELRVFRIMFGIDSVEAVNNCFLFRGAAPSSLCRFVRPVWKRGSPAGNLFADWTAANAVRGYRNEKEKDGFAAEGPVRFSDCGRL